MLEEKRLGRNQRKKPKVKSKTIIRTILVLPLVLGLSFSSFSSLVFASQTGTVVATVRINPLKLEVSVPFLVFEQQRFKVKAKVQNLGETKIEKAKAEIFLPEGLHLISPKSRQNLGTLAPHRTKWRTWWVRATREGEYAVLVEAWGVEKETQTQVWVEETAMVEVRARISFLDIIRRFLARA